MELFIETLTGTAFELRVSPFETIMSVKAKIQRLEGIPISHQHLIWQSIELEDDYCLHDYNIHNGATLKLVLAMRGGPINTRRIPVEDSALREMAEYMEANRDEFFDKLPGNSNVTLLVFREGDKLNFFRVVDPRPDGSLTPLSEALCPVYNVQDEDDDDDDDESQNKEKSEENNKMKEKMDQLRNNMEKMNITKKKKHKTSSPGHGPHSSIARMRLRGLPSAGRSPSNTLNKNMCLPPVGHTFVSPQMDERDGPSGAASANAYTVAVDTLAQTAAAAADSEPSLFALSAGPSMLPAPKVKSPTVEKNASAAADADEKNSDNSLESNEGISSEDVTAAAAAAVTKVVSTTNNDIPSPLIAPHPPPNGLRKDILRFSGLSETPHNFTAASARRREAISMLETLQETSSKSPSLSPGLSSREDSTKVSSKRKGGDGDSHKRSPMSSRKDFVFDTLLRPGTTSRRKEFALESLTFSEAKTMSGILRQASIEKIGSSHIGSIVSSASKSRLSNYCSMQEGGRISTPESRLVINENSKGPSSHPNYPSFKNLPQSAKLQRVSASGERHRISPTHRLPPVKAKKKQKRCFLCSKKTGLATSYQCRCGNNFCATHRYAESHECTFDYKTEGRKLLEQSNPLVSAPKLPKI